jgi:hypothetical protein
MLAESGSRSGARVALAVSRIGENAEIIVVNRR